MHQPKEILTPNAAALAVLWEDGHESFYPAAMLRRLCPCAVCREERTHGGPLRLVHGGPDSRTTIRGAHPVGNYALGISWADGHQTGIYSFEYLRQICSCPRCEAGEEDASGGGS